MSERAHPPHVCPSPPTHAQHPYTHTRVQVTSNGGDGSSFKGQVVASNLTFDGKGGLPEGAEASFSEQAVQQWKVKQQAGVVVDACKTWVSV